MEIRPKGATEVKIGSWIVCDKHKKIIKNNTAVFTVDQRVEKNELIIRKTY